MSNFNQDILSVFNVSIEDLRKLISVALSRGGDYADLYFEYSVANDVALRDREVNALGSHIDYGVGIRVVAGEKSGFAYTEITTMEEMSKAAKMAAQIADSQERSIFASPNTKILESPDRYPMFKSWEEHTVTDKIPYLQKMNDLIFQSDERVTKVTESISDSTTKILFYNSLGELYYDIRPMASIIASVVMKKGSRIENATSSRSFRMGFEMLSDCIISEMADEVIKRCRIQFNAIQPPGGEMPVVMGAGSSGILLHEAIGHAFEADFNRKNISIFSDKFGKKICHHSINIIDDATIMHNRGSLNFDDEGVTGQKTYMVRDGVLNSYLHDRISAKHYGTDPTGNGRRESFRHIPIPRMRATYMENGDGKESDLIAEVKRGIFVDTFSNGQVQIGAGDFTFFVKSGYLIENGKLTQPVKDINIIGNGPQALADIQAVADNNRIDNGTWTCGKEQYCAVSCGMPSALIKKLTVGGSSL